MPKMYEQIRDKLMSKGFSEKEAKTSAARIYNSERPKSSPPVTRNSEKTARTWKRGKR